MIGAHRKRVVHLHSAGLRERAKDPFKIEVPWTVVDKVVGPDQLRRLAFAHLANRWTKSVMFLLGSGNRAPDVYGSAGLTRELQRTVRALKTSLRIQACRKQTSPDDILSQIVELLAEGQVGNCNDNAQAAAVFLAAFMPRKEGGDPAPEQASLLADLLKEPELQALAQGLGNLVESCLPPGTELHVIGHAKLEDHSQLFMSTHKALAENNDEEVIVVDPWLVIPLVHLKTDESHSHAYSLRAHPLVSENAADGEGTQTTNSITKPNPVFAQTVQKISEAGRNRLNLRRDELLRSVEINSWLKKHSGQGTGIYDGSSWPVRRSYMVRYKESESSEPIHFHDYDLDDYFDKRLKMLLVDEYQLLFEESDLVELPYTGGAEFSKIIDELIDGNASPLIGLLHTLPPFCSASSKLLTDLLMLGCPNSDERASAIQTLCHWCLTTPSTSDSLSIPIEQEVLTELMWGIVSSCDGMDMHLLPPMLDAIKDGLNSSDRALARQRAAACLAHLPDLGKDLVRLAAREHWELRALCSSDSAPPDAHDTLRKAVTEGHIGGVKLLLNGDWPDLMHGSEVLVSIAAGHLDWQVVQALVENGAKVNHRDASGKTAVHHAATHGRLIDFVLKAGGDPNAQDNEGTTPAMHAPNAKAMRAFIACPGVDWSLTDQQGNSALLVALKHEERFDAALVLATMDSSMINQANKNGEFPLLLAAIGGNHSMLEALLANKQVDPNQRGAGKQTVLMRAVLQADVESVRLLLNHPDTDVKATYRTDRTALSICKSLAAEATDPKTKEDLIAIKKMLLGPEYSEKISSSTHSDDGLDELHELDGQLQSLHDAVIDGNMDHLSSIVGNLDEQNIRHMVSLFCDSMRGKSLPGRAYDTYMKAFQLLAEKVLDVFDKDASLRTHLIKALEEATPEKTR